MAHRNRDLGWLLIGLLSLVCLWTPAQAASSAKKGFATVAARDPQWKRKITSLHVHWLYTWGLDKPPGLPQDVEFVPMDWGYWGNKDGGVTKALAKAKTQPGVRSLLGFNEPDSTTQANLSVEGALEAWPLLMQTGLTLGSPAPVHVEDDWMRRFMQGMVTKKYRVDFICIHWYGGNDPSGFLGYLAHIHDLYHRPLWVTEFCPADWSAGKDHPNHYTPQQMADFMRAVVPELNKRGYVQRYAWYSAATNDPALGPATLFNNDGSLTDLGRLYAAL